MLLEREWKILTSPTMAFRNLSSADDLIIKKSVSLKETL